MFSGQDRHRDFAVHRDDRLGPVIAPQPFHPSSCRQANDVAGSPRAPIVDRHHRPPLMAPHDGLDVDLVERQRVPGDRGGPRNGDRIRGRPQCHRRLPRQRRVPDEFSVRGLHRDRHASRAHDNVLVEHGLLRHQGHLDVQGSGPGRQSSRDVVVSSATSTSASTISAQRGAQEGAASRRSFSSFRTWEDGGSADACAVATRTLARSMADIAPARLFPVGKRHCQTPARNVESEQRSEEAQRDDRDDAQRTDQPAGQDHQPHVPVRADRPLHDSE